MNRALLVVGLAVLAIAGAGGITYAANHAFETSRTDTSTVAESVRRVVVDVDAGDVRLVAGGRRVSVRSHRRYVLRAARVSQHVRDGVLTIRGRCPRVG